jgi:hypothetical protein
LAPLVLGERALDGFRGARVDAHRREERALRLHARRVPLAEHVVVAGLDPVQRRELL